VSVIANEAVPFLPRGVRMHWCDVRKGWYLLAPERAVKMDKVAAAILEAADGARTLAALIDKLAVDFAAPRAQIEGDVRKFLSDLIDRRMVEVRG